MRLKIGALALVVAAFALGVAAPETARAHYENSYFPLHVGNSWTYDSFGGQKTVSVDASWVNPVSGQIWFRTREYNGAVRWLNQNSAGRVFEYPGRLWYRLGVTPRTFWTMSLNEAGGGVPCSNGARLEMVARGEMVTVPAGRFSTVHVRYRTSCADVGITDEWFAYGVGLVKRMETSFIGPRETVLVRATIGGRRIGQPATPAAAGLDVTVKTSQPDYYENHMPVIGGGQRSAPTITIEVTVRPANGRDAVVNFTDYNTYLVVVTDPSGNQIYMSPQNRVMAPVGGVNRTFPGAGTTVKFDFQPQYGSPHGTYSVKATIQTSASPRPEASTTYSYSWTF